MSKKKKAKLTIPRNTIAVAAKFRNSAGSMGGKPEETDIEEMKPLHCACDTAGCHRDKFEQITEGCWCDCNTCTGIERGW